MSTGWGKSPCPVDEGAGNPSAYSTGEKKDREHLYRFRKKNDAGETLKPQEQQPGTSVTGFVTWQRSNPSLTLRVAVSNLIEHFARKKMRFCQSEPQS